MIRCNECNRKKRDGLFGWRLQKEGKRRATCLSCMRKLKKTRREELSLAIYNYLLEHPCSCGEKNPVCLEFDHVSGQKKMNISEMIGKEYSLKAILEEIKKCEVVCSNCHLKRTASRAGFFMHRENVKRERNWYLTG